VSKPKLDMIFMLIVNYFLKLWCN